MRYYMLSKLAIISIVLISMGATAEEVPLRLEAVTVAFPMAWNIRKEKANVAVASPSSTEDALPVLAVEVLQRTVPDRVPICEKKKVHESFFYFAKQEPDHFKFSEKIRSDGQVQYSVVGSFDRQDQPAQHISAHVLCSSRGIVFLSVIYTQDERSARSALDRATRSVQWN